jgi:hypothetical protein
VQFNDTEEDIAVPKTALPVAFNPATVKFCNTEDPETFNVPAVTVVTFNTVEETPVAATFCNTDDPETVNPKAVPVTINVAEVIPTLATKESQEILSTVRPVLVLVIVTVSAVIPPSTNRSSYMCTFFVKIPFEIVASPGIKGGNEPLLTFELILFNISKYFNFELFSKLNEQYLNDPIL